MEKWKIWGFVDGVKFKVEQPKDAAEQNAYYTAFKRCHVVNNVIAFDALGK